MPSRPIVKAGLSPNEVDDLYSSYRDANRYIVAKRDASSNSKEKVGQRVVSTLEVAAGAAGVGFVAGLTGSTSIGPVPTGLAVAGAYYAAEALDFVPDAYSKHLENIFGKGAIAGYVTMWAAGQGHLMKQDREAKANAGAGAGAGTALTPPPGQIGPPAGIRGLPPKNQSPLMIQGASPPGHLTEAELVAIMQKRREQGR